MNLIMTEQNLSSRPHNVFRIPAPMMHRQRLLRPMDSGMTRERFSGEWLAQRTWEDDGGRIAQALPRALRGERLSS
jgi:hypothetical protein